ncbi:MAG: hypothetical protein ABIR70_09470 [Bryobacteraceae bacterium]
MTSLKNIAPLATGAIALAVLAATLRAFLNHEIGSLALLIASQISLLSLFFVPPVLSEVRDRQTLSLYRAMYTGR